MKGKFTLLGPFKQAVTMDGLGMKGVLSDDSFPVIPNAGILINDGKIEAIGDFRELQPLSAHVEAVDGNCVVMPGLVDVHTHLCWAGMRAKDYAMRLAGKTYLEIAQQGGGIWNTVTATRAADKEDLTRITRNGHKSCLARVPPPLKLKAAMDWM